MQNGEINWRWDGGKSRRQVVSVGLKITKEFRKGLRFCKAKKSFLCHSCQEKKPKGIRFVGGAWEKICIDCVEEWVDESKKTMEEITERLDGIKVELSENKDRWRKEQILGAIEGE